MLNPFSFSFAVDCAFVDMHLKCDGFAEIVVDKPTLDMYFNGDGLPENVPAIPAQPHTGFEGARPLQALPCIDQTMSPPSPLQTDHTQECAEIPTENST